jgi:hypothetical protein
MELKYIRTDKCPICGCSTVVEEKVEVSNNYAMGIRKIRKHNCGGQWESRTFSCGQQIKYCPNSHSEEVSEYSVCTENEKFREEQRQEEKFRKDVDNFIKSYDIGIGAKKRYYWSGTLYNGEEK